ncbi:MAG: S8 family serine peptidase, partial [bacterium]
MTIPGTRFCTVWIFALLLTALDANPAILATGGEDHNPSNLQLTQLKESPVLAKRAFERLVQEAGTRPLKAWVFFTDKSIFSQREYREAISAAKATILPRARHRRQKALGEDLLDFYDLPVSRDYLNKLKALGAKLLRQSRWLNGVSVRADLPTLEKIARFRFVRQIRPVARFKSPDTQPFGQAAPERNLRSTRDEVARQALPYGPSFDQVEQIQVPALHEMGFSGNGVIVGILDTGFNKEHDALRTRDIIAEHDFIFDDNDTQNEPQDVFSQHNHGTGVFSVLGGFAPQHLIGPAYGASFVLAKTENVASETRVEEDNWVAALEWADSLGAEVVSSSLAYLTFDDGSGYTFSELDGETAVTTRAASLAASRGIVLCNAIGNSGPGVSSLWTPADAKDMFAVGAVDFSNRVAGFSSRGPTADGRTKPEVVARGVSTLWANAQNNSRYNPASGTSLATPLVSGSVALLLEAHPDWTPQQVMAALKQTAGNAAAPDNNRGWGLIDVLQAATGIEAIRHPLPFSLLVPAGDDFSAEGIRLTWRQSPDPDSQTAVQYEVLLAADVRFTDVVARFTTADTTFMASSALLEPGQEFYWKVTAFDGEGLRRDSRETLVITDRVAYEHHFTQITSGPIVEDAEFSSGCSWGDFNNDGYLDMLVSNLSTANSLSLYQNNGDGTFSKVTTGDIARDVSRSSSSIWGDFNNDGFLDLYVSNGGDSQQQPPFFLNFLYQNDGPPNYTLTRVTTGDIVADSAFTLTSSWVDYDNDGDLDLHTLASQRQFPDSFYENDGSGHFTKITTVTFVNGTAPQSSSVGSWIDFDQDGDQDVLIAKNGSDIGGEPNQLYLNLLSETGTLSFQQITSGDIVTRRDFDFSASWGDYDNDGDPDVTLSVFGGNNVLYRNDWRTSGRFTRITTGAIVNDGGRSLGSGWGDYDNDGDLDLYVTSAASGNGRLYRNDGGDQFTRVTTSEVGRLVANVASSQSCAWGDYDNDGDLDLYVVNATPSNGDPAPNFLYRNDGGTRNNWLNVTCVGTTSNKAGIGANVRIKATVFGKTYWQVRHVSGSPTGDRSQNSLRAHFGLGDAASIDSLRIEWPSGRLDVLKNVAVNQFLTIEEGSTLTSVARSPQAPQRFVLRQNYPNPFNPTTSITYDLPADTRVVLRIYNLLGETVRTLVDGPQPAGTKTVVWDGKDSSGTPLSSGVYIYRLQAGGRTTSKKLVLL